MGRLLWSIYLGEEKPTALISEVHPLLGEAVADYVINVARQLSKLVGVGLVRIALEPAGAGLDVTEIKYPHLEVQPEVKSGSEL